MTIPVLICDDSGMARKQMFRSLPADWDIDVTYAANGIEGVNAIQQGLGEITFLDLNMPEMDGYQVLEAIRKLDLNTMVVVVSGDVQPEAHARVMKLGAMDFIKKPVSAEKITEILAKYGILVDDPTIVKPYAKPGIKPVVSAEPETLTDAAVVPVAPEVKLARASRDLPEIDYLDCYREIANIAMGQAADLLARLLNVFVQLPVPNINFFEISEFAMAMQAVSKDKKVSAVCQGFIGSGISGEAVVLFEDSSFEDMAKLMKFTGDIGKAEELELLLDTANILIGATLRGIAEPLNLAFSQSHPVILGRNCKVEELVKRNAQKWRRMFAIEINYKIEEHDIRCDLLLLFSEEDMPKINSRISYLR